MAATYQRISRRPMLNVVTGGQADEQRRFGDHLPHDERYQRTREFLSIVRGAWSGTPYDFRGDCYQVEGATLMAPPEPPPTSTSAARPRPSGRSRPSTCGHAPVTRGRDSPTSGLTPP